jgi:hypothetical protein
VEGVVRSWTDVAAWTLIGASSVALVVASSLVLGGSVALACSALANVAAGMAIIAFVLRRLETLKHRTAFAWLGSLAWVATFLPCGALLYRLPVSEEIGQSVVEFIASPIVLVSRLLFGFVDLVGPAGRPEPPSMYLPAWAGYGLLACSAVPPMVFTSLGALCILRRASRGRQT